MNLAHTGMVNKSWMSGMPGD